MRALPHTAAPQADYDCDFADTATFVPVIQVFGLLQSNLETCFQALLGALISASQIREVLWLLAYQSDEVVHAGGQLCDAEEHQGLISAVDAIIRDQEVNARDVRTVAPLLRAVSELIQAGHAKDAGCGSRSTLGADCPGT